MAGFGSRAKWGAVGALAVLVAAAAWWGKSDDAARTAPVAVASAPGKQASPKALDKPLWKDLNLAQQIALEPLQSEWDTLAGVRKKKWLDIANRYSSMKPDEQNRVHERMTEWIKMTPEQRSQVRRNFSRAQKIDPSQKSAQWEEYQQLPDEQKKELAAKAATKKQVVNLPTPAQSKMKTVAPIKHPNAVTVPAPISLPAGVPGAAPAPGGAVSNGDAAGAASGAAGAAGSAAGAAASAAQPSASNVPPVPPAPPSNVK
jgi:hypothetical protein